MTVYRTWRVPAYDPLTITDETLAQWQREIAEINKLKYELQVQKTRQMMDLSAELFDPKSREHQYILKLSPSRPCVYHLHDVTGRIAQAKQKAWQDQRALQKAVKTKDLTDKAILWLMDRGLKLCVDFGTDNALDIANDLATEDETKKLSEDDGYFDFSGQNCDDCPGWDGESNRCECGNRRVCWERADDHTFLEPHLEAVAY